MQYTEKEFNRCLVNPMRKQLLHKDTKLESIWKGADDEDGLFDDDVTREKICRYIVCMYDPESPLLKESVFAQRKADAAVISGYDLDADAKFLEEHVYSCSNEYVLTVLVNYQRLSNNRLMASINADEQTYWEFVKRLMEPITKGEKDRDMMSALDIKTKLSEAKEVINKRLTENWKKLFAGDEDAVKEVVRKRRLYTPEEDAGIYI